MPAAVRSGAIEEYAKRSINAVFDEGVSTPDGWLDQALENGYEILSLEPEIVKKLEQMGYSKLSFQRAVSGN